MDNWIADGPWLQFGLPPNLTTTASMAASSDRVEEIAASARVTDRWRLLEASAGSWSLHRLLRGPRSSSGASAPPVTEVKIHFEDRSSDLGGRERAIVQRAAAALRATPGMRAVIGGIASQPGTAAEGVRVGLRRVQAIRQRLIAEDVDPGRIGVAVRGPGWSLFERSAEAAGADGFRSECRLQITDPHWSTLRS